MGHPCGTLVGHSCRTLLRDTLKGHSCGTLLYETLVGYSCRTLLRDTLVEHSCGTLLWDTLVGHSSYETSSKSHTSSLQNERFVRDFLQKSHVKSPKCALRTRLPPKVTCQVSKTPKVKRKHPSEHTHHAALPSSFASPAPPHNTRSHANPTVTATFTSTTTHNLTIPCACHESFRIHTSNAHKVLRLPRTVTSVTPRNLTIPCACHENRTSTPHKVLRLPRKVAISSHVSFNKICTTPHVWNDFDPF